MTSVVDAEEIRAALVRWAETEAVYRAKQKACNAAAEARDACWTDENRGRFLVAREERDKAHEAYVDAANEAKRLAYQLAGIEAS